MLSKKTLKNTFRMLDREASGFVSMARLKELLIREHFLKKEHHSEPALL